MQDMSMAMARMDMGMAMMAMAMVMGMAITAMVAMMAMASHRLPAAEDALSHLSGGAPNRPKG